MKIIWSPLAAERATEIADYIAFDNPKAAQDWIDTIFKKIETLKSSLKLGRVVPETEREEVREILYRNYRIIYHLSVQKISILTIRHGKQILPVEEILA
ncbi:MAG: type II toxin-antitoxin system RelE/ParE family toxin [Thermodesulfobacteriota bacterium]